MLTKLKRLLRVAFETSPKENLESLGEKIRNLFYQGNTLHPNPAEVEEVEENCVVPEIWDRPIFKKLILSKLSSSSQPIILIGGTRETAFLKSAFVDRSQDVTVAEWDWDADVKLGGLSTQSQIIVCNVPLNESQWRAVKKLRERYPGRIIGIQELILPFTTIQLAQSLLQYWEETATLDQIAPYYIGERFYGPVDELNKVFPLAGKTVIELGPLDGCQTAGLIRSGVRSVTCIEVRAENVIKTLIARYVFGWNNVTVVMDDFHNADSLKYGVYDLAFAHGVYYHSIAPFLFLENLLFLSDSVFLGGYCATDSLPVGAWQVLEYRGRKYRVKKYKEYNDSGGGVNRFGYCFHKDDLTNFFEERNCEVTVISDEQSEVIAGRYLRFLARNEKSVS